MRFTEIENEKMSGTIHKSVLLVLIAAITFSAYFYLRFLSAEKAIAFLIIAPILIIDYGWSDHIPTAALHVIPALALFITSIIYCFIKVPYKKRLASLTIVILLWLVYGAFCANEWSP